MTLYTNVTGPAPLTSPERSAAHTPLSRDIEWTPEIIAELRLLWPTGESTVRIAAKMSQKFGIEFSKNAVIGKVRRLDMPMRRAGGATKARTKEVMSLAMLRTTDCAWPEGDPGNPTFHFCGAPAVEGKPYCADHCAKAYVRGLAKTKYVNWLANSKNIK